MIYYQTPPFGEHILKTMHTKVVPMETKGEKNRSHASSFLICTLLVCCMLLAASGVTFALYTVRELAQLKAQLHHQEKVIESLQGTSTSPDVQVRKSLSLSHVYCLVVNGTQRLACSLKVLLVQLKFVSRSNFSIQAVLGWPTLIRKQLYCVLQLRPLVQR